MLVEFKLVVSTPTTKIPILITSHTVWSLGFIKLLKKVLLFQSEATEA